MKKIEINSCGKAANVCSGNLNFHKVRMKPAVENKVEKKLFENLMFKQQSSTSYRGGKKPHHKNICFT